MRGLQIADPQRLDDAGRGDLGLDTSTLPFMKLDIAVCVHASFKRRPSYGLGREIHVVAHEVLVLYKLTSIVPLTLCGSCYLTLVGCTRIGIETPSSGSIVGQLNTEGLLRHFEPPTNGRQPVLHFLQVLIYVSQFGPGGTDFFPQLRQFGL